MALDVMTLLVDNLEAGASKSSRPQRCPNFRSSPVDVGIHWAKPSSAVQCARFFAINGAVYLLRPRILDEPWRSHSKEGSLFGKDGVDEAHHVP